MQTEIFPDEKLALTATMLQAHIALSAAFRTNVLGPIGLDQELGDLLVRLSKAESGQLRGVDIADQLMISPVRVSRLVDRAESEGLVSRMSDPDDRRAQLVTLTDFGKEKAQALSGPMLALIDEVVFQTLTPSEISSVLAGLEKMRDRATAIATSERVG